MKQGYNKQDKTYTPPSSRLSVLDVRALPVPNGIPERGLTHDTCKKFGIRVECSEVSGKPVAHYFPVTENKKLTGWVRRDLIKPKKYAFQAIGSVSCKSDLLGQVHSKKARRVHIVEGVYDAPSLWQALYNSEYNKKNGMKFEPAVVSIGLGTVNAAKHIGSNVDFLRGYDDIITVFDNDSSTTEEYEKGVRKGQDAVQEVSLVIPEILNVKLRFNDPNDYLVRDEQKALNDDVTFNAVLYEHDNIISNCVGIDTLMTPLEKGVGIDFMPHTMSLLHGLRAREMTVILAPPGAGKTTICKEIGYSLVKAGEKVGHIFLEEDLKKTQQSYIALDNNVHLPKFREDPSILPRDAVQSSIDQLIDNGRTMWMQHSGTLNSSTLVDKFRWMRMKGMDFIILDHISMVIASTKGSNERKDVDTLLTDIAAFVTSSGCHVIVVSHIKRVNRVLKKDKDNSVIYPYWEEVDADMARSSGIFEQTAWNIIALEPEKLKNKERGKIRTRVLKNREWGWLGIGDVMDMHQRTGRLQTVSDY